MVYKSVFIEDTGRLWMTNNIKDLRLAFLLTPKQLAARLGIEVDLLKQLERSQTPLADEWVEAMALAFGVPTSAVSDPATDIEAVAAAANSAPTPEQPICRIGARFAIQAMVAKLGGLNIALNLSEDALAKAVQNLLSYAEENKGDDDDPEKRFNRLSQSLQIAVLTILQSRGVEPDPQFAQSMATARHGALSLLQSFSQIDQARRDSEN